MASCGLIATLIGQFVVVAALAEQSKVAQLATHRESQFFSREQIQTVAYLGGGPFGDGPPPLSWRKKNFAGPVQVKNPKRRDSANREDTD